MNRLAQEYFRSSYENVMYSGWVGFYSRITHRIMEYPYRNRKFDKILEVGAGKGQHFEFVKCKFNEYIETDLDSELITATGISETTSNFSKRVVDAEDLSQFIESSFDRLIATCLLAHLQFPEIALQHWRRVVSHNGFITIYVPTEPGFFLRSLRKLIMVPKSKRFGYDHISTIYRDHRNHYPMMQLLIEEVFSNDHIKRMRFPFPGFGWNFNLFEIYQIRVSKS